MKTFTLLVSLFLLLSCGTSFSQVVPTTTIGYVEGPIREITYNPDGTATLIVQNVTVHIPAALAIDSPTTTLTVRQLCMRNKLPGRIEPGFLGGTALINGEVDLQTFRFTATSVTVEPAETQHPPHIGG